MLEDDVYYAVPEKKKIKQADMEFTGVSKKHDAEFLGVN